MALKFHPEGPAEEARIRFGYMCPPKWLVFCVNPKGSPIQIHGQISVCQNKTSPENGVFFFWVPLNQAEKRNPPTQPNHFVSFCCGSGSFWDQFSFWVPDRLFLFARACACGCGCGCVCVCVCMCGCVCGCVCVGVVLCVLCVCVFVCSDCVCLCCSVCVFVLCVG